MNAFDRITHQPGVMGRKACVRGMRVTVGMIVGQIGAGRIVEELLAEYPCEERRASLGNPPYKENPRQAPRPARLGAICWSCQRALIAKEIRHGKTR